MRLHATANELLPELRTAQRKLLLAGGVGALLSAVALLIDPAQFFRSYLTTYLLLLSVTLGCLALGMIHQVSGGAWGVVIRRVLGAATRTLPALTLLFVPIVVGLHYLYPWTDAATVAKDEVLQWKRPYLNVPFFLARALLYFLVWNGIAYFLNKWSLEQDATGDPRYARRMQLLSAGGLLAYGLTITFASFDWVMSLEPHWFSTMFGVLLMGGQGLSGMAFAIVAVQWLSRKPPLSEVLTQSHFHDLGNLLLAFVMLWTYFGFSQYLIIWSGNLPEEAEWYVHRTAHGWQLVGLALVIFHFALPFALLLLRVIKRQGQLLAKVAAGVLIMRYVDLFWLTAPAFHHDRFYVHWLDFLLPLSLAAIWLGAFIHQLRGRALLPLHDPEFDEAVPHVRTA
jgi:hypothetical protein